MRPPRPRKKHPQQQRHPTHGWPSRTHQEGATPWRRTDKGPWANAQRPRWRSRNLHHSPPAKTTRPTQPKRASARRGCIPAWPSGPQSGGNSRSDRHRAWLGWDHSLQDQVWAAVSDKRREEIRRWKARGMDCPAPTQEDRAASPRGRHQSHREAAPGHTEAVSHNWKEGQRLGEAKNPAHKRSRQHRTPSRPRATRGAEGITRNRPGAEPWGYLPITGRACPDTPSNGAKPPRKQQTP